MSFDGGQLTTGYEVKHETFEENNKLCTCIVCTVDT